MAQYLFMKDKRPSIHFTKHLHRSLWSMDCHSGLAFEIVTQLFFWAFEPRPNQPFPHLHASRIIKGFTDIINGLTSPSLENKCWSLSSPLSFWYGLPTRPLQSSFESAKLEGRQFYRASLPWRMPRQIGETPEDQLLLIKGEPYLRVSTLAHGWLGLWISLYANLASNAVFMRRKDLTVDTQPSILLSYANHIPRDGLNFPLIPCLSPEGFTVQALHIIKETTWEFSNLHSIIGLRWSNCLN